MQPGSDQGLFRYEIEVARRSAASLLTSPSLLAAYASERGVSIARAELQLLQVPNFVSGAC